MLLGFGAQRFDIESPIVVEQEDVLAVVAALGDMTRDARCDHPGLA